MKILITGGAGFIGSAVVRRAIADGCQVVNVDALTYSANLENVAEVEASPAYAFEEADICDRPRMEAIFAQHSPDAVMHLAAESHNDRAIEGPLDFVRSSGAIPPRAVGVLRAIDREIRSASGGSKSLDDVVRELAEEAKPITLQRFRELATAAAGAPVPSIPG